MDGNAEVTMFSMNKYITPHLVEKLDKSAYIHEESEKSESEKSESEQSGSEEEGDDDEETGSEDGSSEEESD